MKLPAFDAILAARLSRRAFVAGAASAGLAACARTPTSPDSGSQRMPARGIAPQTRDEFVIADGYRYNIVARWGDSLFEGTPDIDTRRLANLDWLDEGAVQAQLRQFGTNADAVQYFPQSQGRVTQGLACVNNEYFNAEMVFAGHGGIGMNHDDRKRWMLAHPQAVRFMQTALGVSIMQLRREREGWARDLDSRYTRRITANTPMEITGPARAHPLLRTRADPTGTKVFGTFANCAAGKTPWGTYLTSEENVDDYFSGSRSAHAASPGAAWIDAMRRFPHRENSFYGWDYVDPRFDMRHEPNEPMRFGWMVEIDPHDPLSVPRKRTALGRFQHEGANTIVGRTGHVAAYMGDDEKFEYIYKFVTRDRFDAKNPAANRDLLDHGTLYAARFNADGTGDWLPLVHDEKGPLNSAAGFANQGDVVIKVRAAADLLGATTMDRPEDVEPSPVTGRIYVACTNSKDRGSEGGDDHWTGRQLDTGVNPANPRANNRSGHIIEITEAGDDATATRFEWNVFLLAGDPAQGRYIVDSRELAAGKPGSRDTYFAGYQKAADQVQVHCPDNLGIDPQGRLWIVTDSDDRNVPNNGCFVMETAGPQRGLLRQLASGPVGCEVCGCEFTPDARTLFLSIQHPGEGGSLARPRSHWPDGNGLPARAALLAIEREDGGPV
jgi:secreted PhoX family phosphatase